MARLVYLAGVPEARKETVQLAIIFTILAILGISTGLFLRHLLILGASVVVLVPLAAYFTYISRKLGAAMRASTKLKEILRVENGRLYFKEPLLVTPCSVEILMSKPKWICPEHLKLSAQCPSQDPPAWPPERLIGGWDVPIVTPTGESRRVDSLGPEDFDHVKPSVLMGFLAEAGLLSKVDKTMWIKLPAYCLSDPRFEKAGLYIAYLPKQEYRLVPEKTTLGPLNGVSAILEPHEGRLRIVFKADRLKERVAVTVRARKDGVKYWKVLYNGVIYKDNIIIDWNYAPPEPLYIVTSEYFDLQWYLHYKISRGMPIMTEDALNHFEELAITLGKPTKLRDISDKDGTKLLIPSQNPQNTTNK